MTTSEQKTKRIAELNDLAPKAMGLACRLVQTQGILRSFVRGAIGDPREARRWKRSTFSPRTTIRTASAISGPSTMMATAFSGSCKAVPVHSHPKLKQRLRMPTCSRPTIQFAIPGGLPRQEGVS